MEQYAKTIISQFIHFSKCEISKVERRFEHTLSAYFTDGKKKTFRGSTWNAIAFDMAGFMRQEYFKKNYIDPMFSRERWIIDDSLR